MNRVFISIGSNLGIRLPNILNAIKTIDDDSNIFIISKSPVYESTPMYNINQNKFLNIVLELKTNINPVKLLYLFKGIEEHMGRKLNNKKNQPRIIDIDILDYNKIIYNEKIFIGERIRDLKYDSKNKKIILALTSTGSLGILSN